jgi:phosphoglycolate phosphatase
MQFYDFDEPKAWEAVNFYRERFKVTGLYENRVFDGVTPLLETFGGSRPTVVYRDLQAVDCSPMKSPGISTSPALQADLRQRTGRHADRQGRADRASAGRGKPRPKQTLMIGDRKHDLIGGK